MQKWFLYIVEGKDGSLYTGITTNIGRRVWEHNHDDIRGAKSLKGKRPVVLKYFEDFSRQNEARKREAAIKNWTREHKLKLIKRGLSRVHPEN